MGPWNILSSKKNRVAIRIQAYKTRKVVGIRDDLFSYLDKIPAVENSVLAVSSKVVSLCEGRSVKKIGTADELIKREAERFIDRKHVPAGHALLTLKNSALTASAGVDEFNGHYLLWPRSPQNSAKKIHEYIKKKNKLKNFGVIITDSHTAPLRRGIVGFGLGYWGFAPLRSYRGRRSLSGRAMKMTQANLVDGLAAAAVLVMGEGGEQTPFVLISGDLDIRFITGSYRPKGRYASFEVPFKDDIYRPLLETGIWRRSKRVGSGTKSLS